MNVVSTVNEEAANIAKEIDRGTSLWRWCIILALIFLAVEVGLLRFWKTA